MKQPNLAVTDFDGTITEVDFYEIAVGRCVRREGARDYWGEYSEGKISHFDALAGIFALIRCGEDELVSMLGDMRPDPAMAEAQRDLKRKGWDLVVVSNGCGWYIERTLAALGVQAPVVASAGQYVEGGGLVLEEPLDSPFYRPGYGIDKAEVVRAAQREGREVAFAGNGPPDYEAAMLVQPDKRFARRSSWLARKLDMDGAVYTAFDRWSEFAWALCGESGEVV